MQCREQKGFGSCLRLLMGRAVGEGGGQILLQLTCWWDQSDWPIQMPSAVAFEGKPLNWKQEVGRFHREAWSAFPVLLNRSLDSEIWIQQIPTWTCVGWHIDNTKRAKWLGKISPVIFQWTGWDFSLPPVEWPVVSVATRVIDPWWTTIHCTVSLSCAFVLNYLLWFFFFCVGGGVGVHLAGVDSCFCPNQSKWLRATGLGTLILFNDSSSCETLAQQVWVSVSNLVVSSAQVGSEGGRR